MNWNRILSGLRPRIAPSVTLDAAGHGRMEERLKMVEEQIAARGITDVRTLDALRTVPRHRFIPTGGKGQAYLDRPLVIGQGQTISQPYIVALMTSALRLTGAERILEIGTGSGYQTALLAELAREVYTLEIHPQLQERACRTLRDLGYNNIYARLGDGSGGWPEAGPFDHILVTAAAPTVPPSLRDQLNNGGSLIIPTGQRDLQRLILARRVEDRFEERELCACVFVPLVGKEGWSSAQGRPGT